MWTSRGRRLALKEPCIKSMGHGVEVDRLGAQVRLVHGDDGRGLLRSHLSQMRHSLGSPRLLGSCRIEFAWLLVSGGGGTMDDAECTPR